MIVLPDEYFECLKIYSKLTPNEQYSLDFLRHKEFIYIDVNPNISFIAIYYYQKKKQYRIIIATAKKYRGQGLTKLHIKNAIRDLKNSDIIKLTWGCDINNITSYKAALSNGFVLESKTKYVYTLGLKIKE